MSADIDLGSLPSRIIQSELSGDGVREINPGDLIGDSIEVEGGGIFSIIKKIAFELSGFISRSILGVSLAPFSFAWGFAVQTTQFIWTFDFNATDESLDQQLSSMRLILAGQLGGTLGNLVGYTVCGIIPSAVIFKFNKELGLYLLKEVGEEALDELLGNLSLLCRSALYLSIRYLLTTAYKSARRAIKKYSLGSNTPDHQLARRLFGDGIADKIEAWGDGKGVWSFSNSFNEFIDNIQPDWLQEFTEEFFEEAFDACVEAGYILARGLDAWYMQKKLEQTTLLGEERGVEITPDRSAESERVVMIAPERLLKPAMTNFLATYQMVENRDIGQFLGEPVREFLKAAPTKLSVKLVWSRYDTPPMYREGVYKPPTLEIKGFKRTMLDFELIKTLMGGSNGRLWGRFWASCSLVDEHGTIVARPKLYAGSEEQADDLLTSLLSLSDFEIGTMSTGEEKRVGRRASGRAMAKETLYVYPAYMTILNAEKVINEAEGRAQISGSYKRRDDRLSLWVSTKPDDWDERIADLLLSPGADSPAP